MKIDRLISIIMILLERRRVSIPELARICEVSDRTISRDIETINQAGIPIVSYPGLHGGVGIMDSYRVEKRLFSTSDITALLMGLGCIRSSLSGEALVHALAKVEGMIPEDQRREIERKAGRIAIDTTPWVGSWTDSDAIALFQQAMEECRLVEFDYIDRMGQSSRRTVEPYRLLLKGARWYMDGYCLTRTDYRLFRLSRMETVTLSETIFTPREYRPAPTVQPQFQDKDVVTVRLFICENARDQFLDQFGSACIDRSDNGGFYASVTLPNGELGYQMLLGFGSRCACLEPEPFRVAFTEYLQTILHIYSGCRESRT